MIHRFTPVENLLLRFDVIPHPLLDSLTYVILGRALQIATKLEVFGALIDKELTLEGLAKETNSKTESLEPVMDCVVALGYVKQTGNKYSLTKRGHTFFNKKSLRSMHNTILFSDYVFGALQNLEENVKRGEPKNVNLDMFTPRQWEIFNKTMIEVGSSNAEEIAKLLPKNKEYKVLLDIGGSHGLHSIAYCKKIPGLKAKILDLAPVKPYAEKVIKDKKMEGKVSFVIGDFLKDGFAGKYDVIFAFNIIHGLKESTNGILTEKIFDALNPDGMYVILDQIKEATGGSDLSKVVAAAQGLMLFNQAGGKTYSFGDVKGWMDKTGFTKINMKKLRAPGNALIYGFK